MKFRFFTLFFTGSLLGVQDKGASTKYEKLKPLIRYIGELESYIRQNTHLIVDYSERYRYGEAISTGFVESTVNYLVAKRFAKKPRHGGSKCNGVKRGHIRCWWCGPKY